MNTKDTPSLTTARPSRPRRWLRRLGWAAIWIVTLAVLATLVENRLGAHAWQTAVAEARATGEPVDPAQVIPPPAADAENFAAIPLFAPLFDDEIPSGPADVFSVRRSRDPEGRKRVESLQLPRPRQPGDWRTSQFADLTVWQRELKVADEPGTPGAAVLAALRKFDPELDVLRQAAKRPRTRFPIRYEDHVGAALPHIPVLLTFSRIAALRALAELSEGNAAAAHDDLLLGFAVAEAPREEPLLISALVRAASLEQLLQPLWEGLARRQWTDAQLASFEIGLQRPDFVTSFRTAMRGERVIFCTQALDALKKDPGLLPAFTGLTQSPGEGRGRGAGWLKRALSSLVPSGWVDFNKAALSRAFVDLMPAADPAVHRFYPRQLDAADEEFKRRRGLHGWNPRRMLADVAFPAVSQTGLRFASTQSTMDLARTAIALERYRLAHGAWPASLNVLPSQMPDVIGGAPLHYRLEQDGSFTLYGIGWNERDDGGAAVWKGTSSPSVDWKEGDWVWPAYPRQAIAK